MTIPQEVADTIVDPKAYADGRIYESYAWLRANDPLGVAQFLGWILGWNRFRIAFNDRPDRVRHRRCIGVPLV